MNQQTTTRAPRPQPCAPRPQPVMVGTKDLVNDVMRGLGHACALTEQQLSQVSTLLGLWTISQDNLAEDIRQCHECGVPAFGDSSWDIETRRRRQTAVLRWTTASHRLTVEAGESYRGGGLSLSFWAGGREPRVFLRLAFNADGAHETAGVAVKEFHPELLIDRPDRIDLLNRILRRSPHLQQALAASQDKDVIEVLWCLEAAELEMKERHRRSIEENEAAWDEIHAEKFLRALAQRRLGSKGPWDPIYSPRAEKEFIRQFQGRPVAEAIAAAMADD